MNDIHNGKEQETKEEIKPVLKCDVMLEARVVGGEHCASQGDRQTATVFAFSTSSAL